MRKIVIVGLMTMLFPLGMFATDNAALEVKIVHRSRPFYYRFIPKLKEIPGRIIIGKIRYDHPDFGKCTYEIVKDLDRSKFFGWCSTKKIPRRQTVIFDIDEDFKGLELSKNRVELGLNDHARLMIEKINNKHNQVLKK